MATGTTEPPPEEIRPEDLTGLFAVPQWLRDLGLAAWLLVGITLLLVGGIWLLALTHTIVMPVLTASIMAAVLSPVMGLLHRHGVPRGADKLRGYLQDAGVSADAAQNAKTDASSSLSGAFHALLDGVRVGISALAGLAVFLSFTALSLLFLLKDGPAIRAWAERSAGIPRPVAHAIAGRTLQSLRNYFGGVTIVAGFNAVLIGLGAVVLDVPQAGAIALVNFVAAYVPYLGAWSAGAFTVLLALVPPAPLTSAALRVSGDPARARARGS